MQLPAIGDFVRTGFLRGTIVETIEGHKRGWRDTMYYVVKMTTPWEAAGRTHIIRLDEIKTYDDNPTH